MSGLISIAVTGINAAQMGLMTTSNNISNASTDGYTRQRVVQASNPTVMTGAGGLGEGVHVTTVERQYSQALNNQVLSAQTNVSSLDMYYSQISQIDNMLADQSAGLSPAVQTFFDGIQAVATNPSSTSARQSMVSAAQSMVGSFQNMYSRLSELNNGVNSQITSTVTSINGYTSQIAEMNQQIVASSALNGQPANDLLDKRDQLVADLNKLVKVNVTTNDDGSYNVFVGTGQQLVVGSKTNTMSAMASSADQSRIVVGLSGASGKAQELPESLISGGSLGGLLSFRSEALDTAFNQLGLVAANVTQTFNAQNALGMDMLGNIAQDVSGTVNPNFVANFFSISDPTVTAKSTNPASSPVIEAKFDAASYNGANFYSNLTASDYQLSYDGSNLTLKRLSDNATWTGADITAINTALATDSKGPQGFTLSEKLAGTYSAGDSYLIQPTRNAAQQFSVNANVAADPRLVAAATPVQSTANLSNTGSASVGTITMGPGYTNIALPINLSYDGSQLTGFPAGSFVTVTSGSSSVQFPIAGPATVVPYTSGSGAKITISTDTTLYPDAMSFSFSGKLNAGDGFALKANTKGVEDGGNIVRLGNLQTQNTTGGGKATFQDSYAAFVNDIGNRSSSAKISSSAQTALLSQATSARDSVSGVNLDEEAANLIKYQQAYQASAKVLEIASKIFDTLLSLQ